MAHALTEELVVVVVVGPTYIGGSPVSVLLEAVHEADSVIVEKEMTVIPMIEVDVSAGAVVIPLYMVNFTSIPKRF